MRTVTKQQRQNILARSSLHVNRCPFSTMRYHLSLTSFNDLLNPRFNYFVIRERCLRLRGCIL